MLTHRARLVMSRSGPLRKKSGGRHCCRVLPCPAFFSSAAFARRVARKLDHSTACAAPLLSPFFVLQRYPHVSAEEALSSGQGSAQGLADCPQLACFAVHAPRRRPAEEDRVWSGQREHTMPTDHHVFWLVNHTSSRMLLPPLWSKLY